jgi:predicted house-cleaning noncanonical NTP pyrophosphatase (MazG superfamily)
MSYPKLVRDKIIHIIQADNQRPIFHFADPTEYRAALKAKLQEEVAEFIANEADEELADILEVLQAICEERGLHWEALEDIKIEKRKHRGGFSRRIVIERIENK